MPTLPWMMGLLKDDCVTVKSLSSLRSVISRVEIPLCAARSSPNMESLVLIPNDRGEPCHWYDVEFYRISFDGNNVKVSYLIGKEADHPSSTTKIVRLVFPHLLL